MDPLQDTTANSIYQQSITEQIDLLIPGSTRDTEQLKTCLHRLRNVKDPKAIESIMNVITGIIINNNRLFETRSENIVVNAPDVDLGVDHMPYSLVPFLKVFFQIWQENLAMCSGGVCDAIHKCYNYVVNLEMHRALIRCNSTSSRVQLPALKALYELAFSNWIEIEDPLSIVRALLSWLNPDSNNSSTNFDLSFREDRLLVIKTLRIYVELYLMRYIESQYSSDTKALFTPKRFVRENLFLLTRRYRLIQKLNRPKTAFDVSLASSWCSSIKQLKKKVHAGGDNYDEYLYLSLLRELEYLYQGLRHFPKDHSSMTQIIGMFKTNASNMTSPLKGIKALVKEIIHLFLQLNQMKEDEMEELFDYRGQASLVCQASPKNEAYALKLVGDIQRRLYVVAQMSGHQDYAGDLLNVLGVIATQSYLPQVRLDAFFGSNYKERSYIIDFIRPVDFKSKHASRYHVLHVAALNILKNIVTQSNPAFFDAFMQQLIEFNYEESEANNEKSALYLSVLDGLFKWIEQPKLKEQIHKILHTVFQKTIDQLSHIDTSTDVNNIKRLAKLAVSIQLPDVWKSIELQTVKEVHDKLIAYFDHACQPSNTLEQRELMYGIRIVLTLCGCDLKHMIHLLTTEWNVKTIVELMKQHVFEQRIGLYRSPKDLYVSLKQWFELMQNALDETIIRYMYEYLSSFTFYAPRMFVDLSRTFQEMPERLLPAEYVAFNQQCAVLCQRSMDNHPVCVEIHTWQFGQLRQIGMLAPEAIQPLIDQNTGRLIDNKHNRSTALPFRQLYVKADKNQDINMVGTFGLNELAGRSFMRLVTGQSNLAQLVWFRYIQSNQSMDEYPVLLTSAIQPLETGKTLKAYISSSKPLCEQTIPGFNQHAFLNSFSRQLLFALLIQRGDGKFNNYLITHDSKLIAIDLEDIFVPNFITKEGLQECGVSKTQIKTIQHTLGIKNGLFCMEEMNQPISDKVIQEWLSLNPEGLLRDWFAECALLQQQYASELLKPFQLSLTQILQLINALHRLQRFIQSAQDHHIPITHWDILQCLEPQLFYVYRHAHHEASTPEQRFQLLTKDLYDYVTVIPGCELWLFEALPEQPVDEKYIGHYCWVRNSNTLNDPKLFYANPETEQWEEVILKDNRAIIGLIIDHQSRSEKRLEHIYLTSTDIEHVISGQSDHTAKVTVPISTTQKTRRTFRAEQRTLAQQWKHIDHTPLDDFFNPKSCLDACTVIEAYHQANQECQSIITAIHEAKLDALETFVQAKPPNTTLDRLRWHISLHLITITLERLDCSDWSETVEKRMFQALGKLLTLIQNSAIDIRSIHIRSAKTLTDKQFDHIVQHCPKLYCVTLEDCPLLTAASIRSLEKHANHITRLTLVRLGQLNSITSGRINSRLSFPELHECIIRDCPQLTSIRMVTPLLRRLTVNQCARLTTIQTESQSIRHLQLNELPLLKKLNTINATGRINRIPGNALLQIYTNDTTLRELNLNHNNIGAAGAASLADALKHNTTLMKLKLNWNKTGAAGATSLADALKHNITLTQLELSENNMGAAGATSLADALKHNTTLTQLELSKNNMGAAGASSLADALKHNTTLTELNLGSNNIGAAGTASLADPLKHNTTLTQLDIAYINISAAGASSLADALKHNTTLTNLDLREIYIGSGGFGCLAEVLMRSTILAKLSLRDNGFGAAGAKFLSRIEKYLKRNRKLAKAKKYREEAHAVDVDQNQPGPLETQHNGLEGSSPSSNNSAAFLFHHKAASGDEESAADLPDQYRH